MSMRYKRIYSNADFLIEVNTNSKPVIELIDNSLDFGSKRCRVKAKIKIRYFLEAIEESKDDENYLYTGDVNKGKRIFLNISEVKVDPKRNIVKARISGFSDLHKERILDLVFFKPLYFIMSHKKYYFVHASVVAKGNYCILVAGNQMAGKTTIALAMGAAGFSVLSDDDCFVKLEKGKARVLPFPTKIGLNDKNLKRYPGLRNKIIKNYLYGDKYRISSEKIAPKTRKHKPIFCNMIIFPKYDIKNRSFKISKISNDEAFYKLLKQSPVMYESRVWTLMALSARAKSYNLKYNDSNIKFIPKKINRLFDDIRAEN